MAKTIKGRPASRQSPMPRCSNIACRVAAIHCQTGG
jgi:hypothetical protein